MTLEMIKQDAFAAGEERGITIGVDRSARRIAKNSLRKGIPFETISEITGLPVEEIQKLMLEDEE